MGKTLADLSPGQGGVVKSVGTEQTAVRQHLIDMGITPRTEVFVVRAAPMGDPIEVRLRSYSLSMRRDDAERILLMDDAEERQYRAERGQTDGARRRVHASDSPAHRNGVRMTTLADGCTGECASCRKCGRTGRNAGGKTLKIGLVGNPNAGKTTLFNALTGAREYVGNRPGVTVERKERRLSAFGRGMEIVDLPGIYSLSAYSMEEVVARDFIVGEHPDAIINIVDATNLERNLYLTVQLLELGAPLVLALNMMDEVKSRGIEIDAQVLSRELGVPVVPISARTGQGVDALLRCCASVPNLRYTALRIETRDSAGSSSDDAQVRAADSRYRYIERVTGASVKRHAPGEASVSERIDAVLTNRYIGIPIFLAVMALLFVLTFDTLGSRLSDGVELMISDYAVPFAGNLLNGLGAPDWLVSLVCDGILTGVGGVLTFLPQIALLFFFLSLLEDSGYLSRTAFLMDRALRRFGLSGKSFIPMLMGFGCSVPAAMSARTMENESDRRMTILLVPFMSCSAKLPVYGMIASAFFERARGLVVLGLYAMGILVGIGTGVLFRKTLFRANHAPFVMELPPYRVPMLKNTLLHVGERVQHFLERAGTVILLMSVVLWFLMRFDTSLSLTPDTAQSLLGRFGTRIAPVFAPLGFGNWQASVALLTGVVAKEAVVSSLSLFVGVTGSEALSAALRTLFTPLSAFTFLVFVLLYVPCMAAVATMRRELNSFRLTAFMVVYQCAVAYLVAFLVHTVGSFFG